MELTRWEEDALAGRHGEVQEMAYRILVATGEATDARGLAPVQWAHLSGVNYNTIGDAGERFLRELSAKDEARVKVMTTLNPMGYDADSVDDFGLDDGFIAKQRAIAESYERMGVIPSFSCIPYDIFDIPERGTRVAFAESNAAIHANSVDGLHTNKESALSALASALTGKSPYSDEPGGPDVTIRMRIDEPDDLDCGLLGFFAGSIADASVCISGMPHMDRRSCKSLCGGMGTSGTCSRFETGEGAGGSERVDFGREELEEMRCQISSADTGDIITLGSPQLGLDEMEQLASMVRGRRFSKRCMVFCPRSVRDRAVSLGHAGVIEAAGCRIMSDCCTCLTPLVCPEDVDAVTTNSVKGGYYLKNATKVGVNLKSLPDIVRDETQ